MKTDILFALVLHVLTGLIGVAGSYAVWMQMLKPAFNPSTVKAWTYTSVCAYVLSWVTAAWYYIQYYGRAVRSIIVEGPYPWGHELFMEWKEHIFIFLPLLSVVLLLATWKLQPGSPEAESRRKSAAWLAAVMTVIGIAVTLSGVAASGAVRIIPSTP